MKLEVYFITLRIGLFTLSRRNLNSGIASFPFEIVEARSVKLDILSTNPRAESIFGAEKIRAVSFVLMKGIGVIFLRTT